VAVVAAVASIVACLPAVGRLSEQLGTRLHDFNWAALAVAFALSLVLRPVGALGWRMVLAAAYGYRLPWGTAVRTWLLAESCRWLPGGVWHYASRTGQTTALGVPAAVAVASIALDVLLAVIAALLLAVVAVLAYGTQQMGVESLGSARVWWIGSIALGAAVAAALAYLALRYLFPNRYLAIQNRLAALRQVRPRKLPTVACFPFYVIYAVFCGLAFYATVLAVRPQGGIPLPAAIAANAVAWVAGMLAVTSGGLGVREAALTLPLTVWMGLGDAVAIAVLWRAVQVGAELVCVAAACVLPPIARGLAKLAGHPLKEQASERS
jgi:uncharacterized membrane protein YbhN (UPF0104 family)